MRSHQSSPPGPSAQLGGAEQWGLQAVAYSRRSGAPLLACLAGLQTPVGGTVGVDLGFAGPPAPRKVGDVEVGMLADFALGGALRAQVMPSRPMPTIALSVELSRPPSSSEGFTARSTPPAVADGLGTAATVLLEDDVPVGHATATFAVPSRGEQAVLPWDDSAPPALPAPLPLDELEEHEVQALRDATTPSPYGAHSWGDRIVAAGCRRAEDSPTDGALWFAPSTATANRAGAVQGAVLVALAARAARAASTPDPVEHADVATRSLAMRFISGATTDTPLRTSARIEHRTRRTVFVDVAIEQGGALRATAGVVCRVAAD